MKVLTIYFKQVAVTLLLSSFLLQAENYYETFKMRTDDDGDGVSIDEGDCNDSDPNIFPYALETCNGIDDNCDGEIDEISFKAYENITVSLDAVGEKILTPSDLMSEFNFPCGIDEIEITPGLLKCSDIGTRSARIRVRSLSGILYSANINVTIIDDVAPIISAYLGNHFNLGHGTGDPTRLIISPNQIASFSDNCGILNTRLSRYEFACTDIGWQWVELEVEDAFHNISREWILIDVQSTGPNAICLNEIDVALSDLGTVNITSDLLNAGSSSPCGFDLFMILTGGPLTLNCSHLNSTITYTLEVTELGTGKTSRCTTAVTVRDPRNVCDMGRSRKIEYSEFNLEVFPNPVHEYLHISWTFKLTNEHTIQIVDALGKSIFQLHNINPLVQNTIINTQNYHIGIYYLQVLDRFNVIKALSFIKV
ncbi:MAG: T9SS type A sorting domain-containing protein [Saprospiraceae bacterium]|nr:T9SS type A sorting domain-containing protein [Saprospiraceae bacterium]